jgi:DNA-binding response OmpR family regulator
MSLADSILVIDDDPSIAAVVADALRRTARSARRAATAADGLSAARDDLPNLIVLDLGLPASTDSRSAAGCARKRVRRSSHLRRAQLYRDVTTETVRIGDRVLDADRRVVVRGGVDLVSRPSSGISCGCSRSTPDGPSRTNSCFTRCGERVR